MKRPNETAISIESTLDDLYANEMNVALSWNPGSGFQAILGDPPLAKKSFPTGGQAARWLKDQALRHFPRAEFKTHHTDGAGGAPLLDDLFASRIAGSISWTWDSGFYATLGAPKQAEIWSAATAGETLDWLREQAIRRYPESEFARRYAGFGVPP